MSSSAHGHKTIVDAQDGPSAQARHTARAAEKGISCYQIERHDIT